MDEVDSKQFPGFRKPKDKFFSLPNEWTDITSEIDNLAELKIIEYVIRHTWGFEQGYGKYRYITTDEFASGRKKEDGSRIDKGTGLGISAVKEGVAKAIKHGYILCKTDRRDKGRIRKYYAVKMLEEEKSDDNKDELDGRNPTTHSRKATAPRRDTTMQGRKATTQESDSDHRTEKETRETHFTNTDEKESGTPSNKSEKVEIPPIANQTVRRMMGEYAVKDAATCMQRIADVYKQSGMNAFAFHTAIKDAKAKVSPVAEDRFEEFMKHLARLVKGESLGVK